MNSEEERLRELLRAAVPDLGRLAADEVRTRRRRQRLAALTQRAPCPPPNSAAQATRAELRAFHSAAAVTCSYTTRTYPGDGRWQVLVRKASSTDIAELAAVFDRPDQPLTACASSLVRYQTAPLVLVDDAGHYLIPRYPRDHCARPARGVTRAVQDHPWQTLSVRKSGRLATEESRATGCDLRWKNLFSTSTTREASRRAARNPGVRSSPSTRTRSSAPASTKHLEHLPNPPTTYGLAPSCAVCA